MASTTIRPVTPAAADIPDRTPAATGSGDSTPVVLMAGLGAVLLAFSLAVWGRWIVSSEFRPVPAGPDPIPTASLVILRGLEVGGLLLTAWMVWHFLIAPWRRTGRLTPDGLLLLVLPLIWFWDPFENYTQTWFAYNAHLLNLGAWTDFVPGWLGPHQDRFPEPLVVGIGYIFWVFGCMLAGCWIFGRIRARWPRMSLARFLVVGALVCIALDTVLEFNGLLIGWFAYPGGTGGPLTLFDGTRWKFPLLSPLSGGLETFAWVSLRYFRDARGLTLVERGVDSLRVGGRARLALRFLALYAGMVLTTAIFSIGGQWQATHSGSWPASMPSYLSTTCPELKTDPRACGGPGIPIVRSDGTRR
jgi:Spirocyclase AveC-like